MALGAGCAHSQRPVLYPNAKLEDGGKAEAAGATAGLLYGAIKSAGPSPIYKGFVDRCLSNMGYQVIGWQ